MTNTSSNKAYMYLVKLLSARDYSEHKLREKLREKKYPANEIESALNEIKAKGFLREEVYAEARIKAFMNKGYSPEYIRQKLSLERMTVTDEAIKEIFSEHRISVEDQIDRLVRKKMNKKSELDYDEEAKILRFLLSKGHDFSTSKKVIKSLISQSNAQDPSSSF